MKDPEFELSFIAACVSFMLQLLPSHRLKETMVWTTFRLAHVKLCTDYGHDHPTTLFHGHQLSCRLILN